MQVPVRPLLDLGRHAGATILHSIPPPLQAHDVLAPGTRRLATCSRSSSRAARERASALGMHLSAGSPVVARATLKVHHCMIDGVTACRCWRWMTTARARMAARIVPTRWPRGFVRRRIRCRPRPARRRRARDCRARRHPPGTGVADLRATRPAPNRGRAHEHPAPSVPFNVRSATPAASSATFELDDSSPSAGRRGLQR